MSSPGGAPAVRHPPIPVDVLRGAVTESRHVVFGAAWGTPEGADAPGPAEGRLLEAWGDAALFTYLRSALKPVQLLPLLVDGVADRLGLSDEALALAVASHSGQDVHLVVLADLMARAGVEAGMLRCGRHRPFHKDSARRIGEGYTVLHNNCSGKHAAMLAWCRAADVDPTGYLSPDHPLQRRIIGYTSLLAGLPQVDLALAVDGCGVPTVGMPLWAMARLFRFLARPDALLETGVMDSLPDDEAGRVVAALHRVRKVMVAHPLLVAGEERADTDVIRSTAGRIITKAGAEGLWCGVDVRSGTAFAFKSVDGNFRAVVPAALEMLVARRRLGGSEMAALERHHRPAVKNHVGTVVGRIVPHLG